MRVSHASGVVRLVFLSLAIAVVSPSFAAHDFNITTSGTFDSNDSGNWINGRPTNDGQDVNFQQNITSGDQTITNLISAGGGSINYLRLATAGTSLLSVYTPGIDSIFGLQLNARDTLIVFGNSTFSHGNNSFDNLGGTLVISNGATAVVNIGANNVNNNGTISLTAAGGQTTGFNYGQSGQFVNNSNIVVNGAGTSTFVGEFGGANKAFQNLGKITVNSGTLVIDPRDAFTNNGFTNGPAGVITVNSGATFVIKRTSNSWNNGGDSANVGYYILNGGTVTAIDDAGQNVTRTIRNSGTILGNGTLAFGLFNPANTGNVIASNGVLFVGQVFGNNGTWIAKNGGTLLIASNTDLNASVMQINSGGTLQVGNTAASSLANTLTLATSFLNSDGGISIGRSGGNASLTMTNSTAIDGKTFTNSSTGVISGRGTFTLGFGVGNNNAGFINSGTILATITSGQSLTFDVGNTFNTPFSNSASGTIVISNGMHFGVSRTATAWNAATLDSQRVWNSGTIILNDGTFVTKASGAASDIRLVVNAGTIIAQGTGTATNTWRAALENRGTIYVTNNTSVFNVLYTPGATDSSLTNTATGQIFLGGVGGAVGTLLATNLGSNGRSLVNQGLIQGQGTITLGRSNDPRADGSSANLVNAGNLVATNWGNAAAGTLFISVGNAFSNGGFSNTAAGTISIASNITLTVNRTQNAWSGSGNSVANLGTITLAGGTMNLASDGIVSNAASFINSGTISGWGTIDSVVITTNGGKVFANATNLVNEVGTLTLRVASTTNNSSATLGTIGTNAVLNLIIPGGQNVLINFGTISVSGGTINFGGVAGTITNFFVVAGVGNLSSFDIVNTGALASIVAQNPIPGLSNLVASVGVTNSAILGANNSGGAATLTLDTSTGQGLVNNGTIFAQGGFITLTNAAGATATVTNNTGLIYGVGTQSLRVANLSGGTIMASNGVFSVGAEDNLNRGTLTNFNASSTIRLTNSILANQGKIFLNGGGLVLTGSVITNGTDSGGGTITGPGDISSSLYNYTNGFVAATNGTLNVATNAGEFVTNRGTFDVASGSTLNIAPSAWDNTNGTVVMAGGTLTGGTVTNKGTIVGGGTITSAIINAAEGTIKSTNTDLNIRSTSVVQNGTMIGGSPGGTRIVITNITQNLVNQGTMILDSQAGVTNAAFLILRATGGSGDFTNAAGGVIRGAGFFATGDFVPGGRNFTEWNLGTILATNGALIMQPGDAFANGGFVNLGGTVTVANASTFGIQRSSNAWVNSGTVPVNTGLIQLDGGTMRFYSNGLLAVRIYALSNAPAGTITGSGTIGGGMVNAGTLVATNGTLFIDNSSVTNIIQTGTISITGGGASGATLTILGTTGSFQNSGGTMLFSGGTFVATNVTAIRNSGGTISGFGTIIGGRTSGSGGANAEIINTTSGQIIATNGTLFLNPGDAFSAGGLSNSASSTIRVASGAAVALNRTANAWDNSPSSGFSNPRNLGTISLEGGSWSNFTDGASTPSRYIDNFGTITGRGTFSGSITNFGTIQSAGGTLTLEGTSVFRQAGTLRVEAGSTMLLSNSLVGLRSFSNSGTIFMNGGTLLASVITNANWISGSGAITGDVNSGVVNISNSFLYASNGVLTASLFTFTNGIGVTMGTLSTNATLDVQMPGGAAQPLINLGTLSFAGGTLLANGTSSGTISNQAGGIIQGVGNVTQTVVNNGTILAANPVSGLNIFSVGLSDINAATIGASNGTILNVVISGGAGSSFNNNGSISMLGGQLIISNATPGVITNNAFVTGNGSITPAIGNNSNIIATVNGGTLQVTLLGGTNTALGNLRAGLGATLVLSNSGVVNLGTIGANGANGGTIAMISSAGIITNRGTGVISGDSSTGGSGLSIDAYVHNEAGGLIMVTNGVLRFNNVNGLFNTNATIRVRDTGTFQSNSSNSWANAGSIDMQGGTLRTGGFTNAVTAAIFTNTGSGQIVGYGTIIGGGAYGSNSPTAGFDKSIVNLGTIIATNPLSGTAQTLFITTGGATAQDGIQNLGTMIVSSNNTLSLNRQAGLPILNTGTITIQNGTLTGSGVLSNTVGGIIQGYGTLTHDIVNLAGGLIHATNGLLTMTSSIFPINEGTFMISAGSTMTWNTSNSWRNVGVVDLRGGTLRTGGFTNPATTAVFTNTTTGTIVGWGTMFGGGAFNTNGIGIDKSFVNEGLVIASNGVLTIDTGVATTNRGLANLGTMIVKSSNDTLVLRRVAEITATVTNLNFLQNSGTIIINGGTLTSNTSITNQFESVSLPGLIQGFGHIALTNQLVNLGTIRSTNTVAGGDGILRFVNPAGSALQINQSGTLVVEAGPVISEMIFGADTNAALVNSGTIIMRGGFLRSGTLTNAFGARFSGFGTITSPIINSGTGLATSVSAPLVLTGTVFNQTNGVLGGNSGRLHLTSNAIFTNAGTVSFINSIGTFSGAVVNQGAWVMDPSTNVFLSDYTVATNGYITMTAGDVSIFKSNFVNRSYLTNAYDTLNGKFLMDGNGTQLFYVAGLDMLGTNVPPIGTLSQTNAFGFANPNDVIRGYSNNFALGTLELANFSTTVLLDTFGTVNTNDDRVAGLYLDTLTLGANSLLIISNNVQLYFFNTNGVTGVSLGTLNPGDNVLILGNGSFHQFVTIPEPSILMLFIMGGMGINWYRRRQGKR